MFPIRCGCPMQVMMFMHVSPEANMHSETLSTLKFASRVSEITLGQVSGGLHEGGCDLPGGSTKP